MGADNWAVCPNCKREQEVDREKLIAKANEVYGKVTSDEYLELIAETNTELSPQYTLAEMYEIGIDNDGEFMVHFRASCDKCGFYYEYSIAEDVFTKKIKQEDS